MRQRVKVGRNELCPCASGKKYKACCIDKGFTWVRDEAGEISRDIPLDPDLMADLQAHVAERERQLGRKLRPDDKIFDIEPEHFEHRTAQLMREANFHPMHIYAFEKTGLLLSEDNLHRVPESHLEEWAVACQEWLDIYKPGQKFRWK